MKTQHQFNKWVTATYPNVSPATAWQHQQARIDELENEVEKLILLNDKADGKADEIENKLAIAVEALRDILENALSGGSIPKAREALKLIEVSE